MSTPQPDSFDGKGGRDTVSYENSPTGLNIFMIPSGDATGYAVGDTMISIENVHGSNFDDFIHGNDLDNWLYGLAGNDTLYGYRGNNHLYGGPGVDNLVGGPGIDYMDGGEGIDTVSYQLADSGVTASLADQSINTGWAKGDTYINIEDLTGTMYDDILYGDSQAINNIWGLAGNDILYGGPAGYNVLIGDAGADRLIGTPTSTDMADYETAGGPVIASLADPSINTGHAKGDTYVYINDMAGSLYDDILYGDHLNNNFDAWPGNDIVYGGAGNDGIFGNDGDDLLYGEEDWDLIDGGNGLDTAGYHYSIKNYKVWFGDGWVNGQYFESLKDRWLVMDNVNNDGVDTLINIERLLFSDRTVNLTIKSAATTINPDSLQLLQELYVAFFNRVPDADGLEYWIEQFKAGKSIENIADSFYAAGIEASQITGYQPGMSHADFVNKVYQNVLGRKEGADAEGLQFWSSSLADGSSTRGGLVKSILQSAHTYKGDAQWGWVADLLDNKARVADTFSVQMGMGYVTPEESISRGIEIAEAVTATDISTALNLIGVSTDQIIL